MCRATLFFFFCVCVALAKPKDVGAASRRERMQKDPETVINLPSPPFHHCVHTHMHLFSKEPATMLQYTYPNVIQATQQWLFLQKSPLYHICQYCYIYILLVQQYYICSSRHLKHKMDKTTYCQVRKIKNTQICLTLASCVQTFL